MRKLEISQMENLQGGACGTGEILASIWGGALGGALFGGVAGALTGGLGGAVYSLVDCAING